MREGMIETLLEQVRKYEDEEAIRFIRKAYEFAYTVHGYQQRKSGELYIVHPLNVACILADFGLDKDTICAALLHDVIEDGENITKEQIETQFNPVVATLVEGVTKMDVHLFSSKSAQNYANTRKLIMGIQTDLRVILLKLADRLHNMRTLRHLSRKKQIENAVETLEVFVPLANKIGFHSMAKELADLALRYLNYDIYHFLEEKREEILDQDETILQEMSGVIHQSLRHEGIANEVSYRIKNVYSIYEKIVSNQVKPSEIAQLEKEDIFDKITDKFDIHDMRSLKVLVSELEECYHSADILGQEFKVVNGKQKDCIKRPKTNGYQSLHTTIYGMDGMPVQTRIRTHEMDKLSSLGLVSYWQKNREMAPILSMQELRMKFPFFQSLLELDNICLEDELFVHRVKEEVLSNMVYPCTKDGQIIELPSGSTPVDFAYRVCPSTGYNDIISIVNGKHVSLDYQLNTKDVVEILPNKNHSVAVGSLSSYATTECAKRKIRSREMCAQGY